MKLAAAGCFAFLLATAAEWRSPWFSAAVGTGPALSADGESEARCWTPAQLKSRPGERLIRRPAPAPDASRLKEYRPGPPPPAKLRGSIRRVKLPPGKKLVALTFDLCEASREIAGYDGAVVDYLRSARVPATFFAGGKWLLSHKERGAQLLADPLFEVGNHSWSHKNLRLLKGAPLRDEVARASAAYASIGAGLADAACVRDNPKLSARISAPVRLFRFPYGACSRESLDAVASGGMLAIQWDVVTGDPFRGSTAQAIAREVLRSTKPGSIIVAHANGRGWRTAAALPLFVPALRARGYRFVTVSELLKAGEPEVVSDCYELRPGDNLRYDSFARVRKKRNVKLKARKPRRGASASGGLRGSPSGR
jgi:peptidoglycan/xylan/chitin deacetylase (PgdA/CDA1 family)